MDLTEGNDSDLLEKLKNELSLLTASLKESQEKIIFVETKAAILSVEFASMIDTLETKSQNELEKTLQSEADEMSS